MSFDLSANLPCLLGNPHGAVIGAWNGVRYKLKIAIPDYAERVADYYAYLVDGDLDGISQEVGIPFKFKHFGVICEFSKMVELSLHDNDMQLDKGLKTIVDSLGPVIIRNAHLSLEQRHIGHRNRFPHLSFHVDRSFNQPTPYSMFTRDPFDPEQFEPRTASTLFVADLVAYLQLLKEGQCDRATEKGPRMMYNIFGKTDMAQVVNRVVLEQAWCAPSGTGEICVQDNRTVHHASYYRHAPQNGYRIGVRYVG